MDVKILEEFYELNQAIKELKAKADNLKKQVKEELSNSPDFKLEGKAKVKVGDFEVILSKTERVTVDKDGLKEEYPTIFEQFKKVSTSERLTVKKV